MRQRDCVVTDEGLVSATLFDPQKHPAPNRDEIERCKEWICKCCRRQSAYNFDEGSYTLKTEVESQARDEKCEKSYVSNGAFVQAAVDLGYKAKAIDAYYPNVFFNMKVCSPKDAWKRVRPSPFTKWLFRQTRSLTDIGKLARDAFDDKTWPRRASRFGDYYLYLDFTHRASDSYLSALKSAWFRCFHVRPPYPDAQASKKCERFYEGECDVVSYRGSYPPAPKGETHIYALFERGQHGLKVRYIGKSRDPARRLVQHVVCPGSERRVKWIAELLGKKVYPEMSIIDLVSIKEASYHESAFIMAFGDYEREFGGYIAEALLNEYLVDDDVCWTV